MRIGFFPPLILTTRINIVSDIEKIKRQIEAAGFKVMAVTKVGDETRFEAHRVVGSRKLVKGTYAGTPEKAMMSLHNKCLTVR
jgi:hypothetical protein